MSNRIAMVACVGLTLVAVLSTSFFPLAVNALPAEKPQMREGSPMTIVGDVYDSACYYTRKLDKPISHECAVQCAAGGSPLVIVTKEGNVYLPIDNKMPALGQNKRLVKFGGMKVKVTGHVYDRNGSKAIVMDKVELVK